MESRKRNRPKRGDAMRPFGGLMLKTPFYHVTAVENISSILRAGLRGGTTPRNRGEIMECPCIFVLTTRNVRMTDAIAVQQVWPFQDIGGYAVIRISSKGIIGPVVPDDVAEFTAPWQRVIQQDVIHPKYLKVHLRRRLDYPGKLILQVSTAMGRRKLTEEEWAIAVQYFCEGYQAYQRAYESSLNRRANRPRKRTAPAK